MDHSVVQNGLNKENATKRPVGKNNLRDKEFIERNSLIDDLMDSQQMATVFRSYVAISLASILHLAIYEYAHRGEINLGHNLIVKGFKNFHRFVIIWLGVHLSNYLVYYGFKFWATLRNNFNKTSMAIKCCDYIALGTFIIFIPLSLVVITWITLTQEIEIVLVLIVACEMTRNLMKLYAFVRSNVPRTLNYKPHTEDRILYPKLNQFAYFLWAPTLIYRDDYLRTKSIRLKYVLTKVAEFMLATITMSVLLERYVIIPFKDYGKIPLTWTHIGVTVLENIGGGMLLTITLFYIVLHIWQCMFAEICRFGDRQFYQDWWNSNNFEEYYRKWNVIVHDWLHMYIYKDFYEIVAPGNRILAKYMVFLLSSIFHEFILYVSFGFVMPILFIQFFVIGTIVTFLKVKPAALANTLILLSLGLGNAISFSAYGIEYFARLNCPIEKPTFYTYLVPRLFSCTAN